MTGSPLQRENSENGHRKFPVRENTGNWDSSSSKFHGSKDIGYCNICCEIFELIEVSFTNEIVVNF